MQSQCLQDYSKEFAWHGAVESKLSISAPSYVQQMDLLYVDSLKLDSKGFYEGRNNRPALLLIKVNNLLSNDGNV